jgi:hypothetical protein
MVLSKVSLHKGSILVSGKVRAGYPARRDFPSDLFRSVGVNRRNSTSCFEDRKQRERRQLPKDPVYGWTPNKKPRWISAVGFISGCAAPSIVWWEGSCGAKASPNANSHF